MDRRVFPGDERVHALPLAEQDVPPRPPLLAEQLVVDVSRRALHSSGHLGVGRFELGLLALGDIGNNHHPCSHFILQIGVSRLVLFGFGFY